MKSKWDGSLLKIQKQENRRYYPRGISLSKISYTFSENPFVCNEKAQKFVKNTFVLKNLVRFFERVKCPLILSKILIL